MVDLEYTQVNFKDITPLGHKKNNHQNCPDPIFCFVNLKMKKTLKIPLSELLQVPLRTFADD